MTVEGWWKALAIVGTAFSAIAAITVALPPASFLYFEICTLHIDVHLQVLVFFGSFALALPLILTFASAAVRNQRLPIAQRIPWAIILLVASPVAIPYYWWLFLRDSRS